MSEDRKLGIEVADASGAVSAPDVNWIGAKLGDAGALLRVSGEVRVRVVGDAEMAAAHEEFAGVPGTTDVLTFDLTDPEENPNNEPAAELRADGTVFVRRMSVIDTDILVCADEARRQISGREHPLNRELLLYAVHGVLHCLGFDDHEESDAALMHAMEDAVLTGIGVGPAYRSGRPGA